MRAMKDTGTFGSWSDSDGDTLSASDHLRSANSVNFQVRSKDGDYRTAILTRDQVKALRDLLTAMLGE